MEPNESGCVRVYIVVNLNVSFTANYVDYPKFLDPRTPDISCPKTETFPKTQKGTSSTRSRSWTRYYENSVLIEKSGPRDHNRKGLYVPHKPETFTGDSSRMKTVLLTVKSVMVSKLKGKREFSFPIPFWGSKWDLRESRDRGKRENDRKCGENYGYHIYINVVG